MIAEERWVDGAGGALYTCALGEGPPVVVVHGGPGGNHGYLRACLAPLAARHQLIFVDQRFAGRSQRIGRAPRLADHVDDLERVRAAYRAEQLALIGHSRGGLIAMLYALRHPGRVAGLAVVSVIPPDPDFVDAFEVAMAERVDRPSVARRVAELEARLAAEGRAPTERVELIARAQLILGLFHDPARWDGAMAMDHLPAEDGAWLDELGDLRARLTGLGQPVLFIHGEDDPIDLAVVRRLASTMPAARVTALARCGHYAMAEQTDQVNAILADFLAAPVVEAA